MSDYPQTQLYINGVWRDGSKERLSIVNPAFETAGISTNLRCLLMYHWKPGY